MTPLPITPDIDQAPWTDVEPAESTGQEAEQVCAGCGCTDDDGCAPFTCFWVEPNLCSNCQL